MWFKTKANNMMKKLVMGLQVVNDLLQVKLLQLESDEMPSRTLNKQILYNLYLFLLRFFLVIFRAGFFWIYHRRRWLYWLYRLCLIFLEI